jgi:hypothetical protein
VVGLDHGECEEERGHERQRPSSQRGGHLVAPGLVAPGLGVEGERPAPAMRAGA